MSMNIHMLLTLGLVLLSVGLAVQASIFAIQNNMLKEKQLGRFFRYLPPLQTMEKRLYKLLWGGFWLLSILILTSMYSFWSELGIRLVWLKLVFVIMIWGLFLTLLCMRKSQIWRRQLILLILLSGGVLVSLYATSFLFV